LSKYIGGTDPEWSPISVDARVLILGFDANRLTVPHVATTTVRDRVPGVGATVVINVG
jgi:hypothetical protein